jgi:sigma-E factor negative regulatory protein RseC
MPGKNEISHTGRITAVEQDLIRVQVLAQSACSSCHAKGSCSVGDVEEKEVDIPIPKGHSYAVGDLVTVILDESKGVHAILLGYIYPFLVLFLSLLIASAFTDSQGLAGLIALGVLIPYYFFLYLIRGHIKRKFDFRIE